MANNASATVDLKILISVVQNSAQNIQAFQSQLRNMSQQLQQLQGNIAGQGNTLTNLANQFNGLNQQAAGFGQTGKSLVQQMGAVERAAEALTRGLKFLAGGFLALQSVRTLKDWADTAARAEVLKTVLHVVADNAGIASKKIDEIDKSVQRLGITASSSRTSLTQMIQAGLPVDRAKELARASQDLAVITGTDSSETFRRLIINIQQLDALGLRWMGLVIDRQKAEEKYQKEIGKTGQTLSKQEQQMALMNAVLEKAAELAGVYETAMGNVGKQVQSLKRLFENLKVALGDILLPAYSAIVEELTLFLKQAELSARILNAQGTAAERLGEAFGTLARWLREIGTFLLEHQDTVLAIIKAYAVWKAALVVFGLAEKAVRLLGDAFDFLGTTYAKYFSEIDIVGGFTRLIGVLTRTHLIIGLVVGAAVGLTAFLFKFTDLGKVATDVYNKLLTVLKELSALVSTALSVAFRTFGALIEEALQFTVELVSALGDLVRGLQRIVPEIAGAKLGFQLFGVLLDGIRLKIRDMRLELEALILAMEKVGLLKPSGPTSLENIDNAQKAANAAMAKTLAAERKFVNLPPSEEKEKARGDLAEAKKAEAEAIERVNVLLQRAIAEDPKWEAIYQARLKINEKRKQLIKITEEGDNANKELFGQQKAFDSGTGQAFTLDFAQKANALIKLGEVVRESVKLTEGSKDALKLSTEFKLHAIRFAEGLEVLRQGAKEPFDIVNLNKAIDATRQLMVDAGASQKELAQFEANARTTRALAELSVRDAQRASTRPLREEEKRRYADRQEALTEGLRQQLAILREFNTREAAEDEDRYKNALLKFNEYWDRRYARSEEATNAEIRLQEQQIQKLQGQQRFAFPEELPGLQNQIQAARDELTQIVTRGINEREQIRRERQLAQEEAVRQLQRGRLEFAAQIGGQAEAYAVINEKYDEQLRLIKDITAGERELIEARRSYDLFGVTQQFLNQRIADQKQLISDIVQVEEDRLKADQARGGLTTVEVMRRQNEILQRRIEETQRLIELEKISLATQEAQIAAAKTSGQTETLETLQREAIKTKNEITVLTASVQAMTADFKVYGEELRKLFEDQLGEALAKLITDTRHATEAINNLWKALRDNIVGAFTQRIAQSITRRIVEATSQRDSKGEIVPNTDIFERLMKRIGLGTKPPPPTLLEKAAAHDLLRPTGTQGDAVHVVVEEKYKGLEGVIPEIPITDRMKPSLPDWKGILKQASMRISQDTGSGMAPAIDFAMSFFSAMRRPDAARLASWVPMMPFAAGGPVTGPGTGTSDSIIARVSNGEHIMPADKTATWLPVLEAIRTGRLQAFAAGGLVALHSIAIPSVIPRGYAGGGVVTTDAGASGVSMPGGPNSITLSLHPETMNWTLRDWFEHEVARQYSRR